MERWAPNSLLSHSVCVSLSLHLAELYLKLYANTANALSLVVVVVVVVIIVAN